MSLNSGLAYPKMKGKSLTAPAARFQEGREWLACQKSGTIAVKVGANIKGCNA